VLLAKAKLSATSEAVASVQRDLGAGELEREQEGARAGPGPGHARRSVAAGRSGARLAGPRRVRVARATLERLRCCTRLPAPPAPTPSEQARSSKRAEKKCATRLLLIDPEDPSPSPSQAGLSAPRRDCRFAACARGGLARSRARGLCGAAAGRERSGRVVRRSGGAAGRPRAQLAQTAPMQLYPMTYIL
jgi:hypothetical protein